MLIKRPSDIKPSEITSETVYYDRRQWLAGAGWLAAGAALPFGVSAKPMDQLETFSNIKKTTFGEGLQSNSFEDITTYNNFYEYGFGKNEPARYAPSLLKHRPWTIEVSGHCEKPGRYDIDDLIAASQLEERIYRFRCVEAWSMVIPWVGIPLARWIKRFAPTSNAKYVAFETLVDHKQMPATKTKALQWPYREGLRIDEAMHPLTLMAVGLYGKELPSQNGAPVRLVVPWKYGFKSIKSIVRIHFSETEPQTTWNMQAPREYGFYANVNPKVSHPRWSQARERRIGEWFKQRTEMYNGYAEQVASLYSGMDLTKHF